MAKRQQKLKEPNNSKHFNKVSSEVAKYLHEKLGMDFILLGLGSDGGAISSTLEPKQCIEFLESAVESYKDESQEIIHKGEITDL